MKDREVWEVFKKAKSGHEESIQKILEMFHPLLYKNSFLNGKFDEDCFQELSVKLINCIKSFEFSPDQKVYDHLKEVINKNS